MVDLCRVEGTVISPDHEVLPRATVRFAPYPNAVQPSKNGKDVLAPKVVETITDSTGFLSAEIEPGVYQVTISLPLHRAYPAYMITVPDVEEVNLADIQNLPPLMPAYVDEVRKLQKEISDHREWYENLPPGNISISSDERNTVQLKADGLFVESVLASTQW